MRYQLLLIVQQTITINAAFMYLVDKAPQNVPTVSISLSSDDTVEDAAACV